MLAGLINTRFFGLKVYLLVKLGNREKGWPFNQEAWDSGTDLTSAEVFSKLLGVRPHVPGPSWSNEPLRSLLNVF